MISLKWIVDRRRYSRRSLLDRLWRFNWTALILEYELKDSNVDNGKGIYLNPIYCLALKPIFSEGGEHCCVSFLWETRKTSEGQQSFFATMFRLPVKIFNLRKQSLCIRFQSSTVWDKLNHLWIASCWNQLVERFQRVQACAFVKCLVSCACVGG